jgi:tubulin polyglutamylase TTLL4
MLLTGLEEKERLGNFACIYPDPATLGNYSSLFEFPRYNNRLIERFYQDGGSWVAKWR